MKENYRQISLTSIISKVGEKLVRDRIVDFWLAHQIFNKNQFAYLRHKSTLSQLLLCYNDWAKSRNGRNATDVIFLDFTKAFDSVPHERLLSKLEQYGIRGALIAWFRDFLTNRQQRVAVRSTFSKWSDVVLGVPKGTILGPILFLIYINDLPNEILSPVRLFADDTKIYRKLSDIESDTSKIQADLNRMSEWTKIWQLSFNPGKFEVMRITHLKDHTVPEYYLLGQKIKVVNKFKDLGVIMTSNKANPILGLIRRTVIPMDSNIFSILYKSLV